MVISSMRSIFVCVAPTLKGTNMKKILLLLVCSFGLIFAVSSCKAHEDCPAYGSVQSETNTRG